MKTKVVVFTGSGISAESGISTFRDSGGLWEKYRIEDVATPQAWASNRKLVLDFYNQRRIQVIGAQPNAAHVALKQLESTFDVHIITQNVDDLHERAGSQRVLHLHGEIMKSRSSVDASCIYDVENGEINDGELCALGSQKRPHIVWFGEPVYEMDNAIRIVEQAEIFIVTGTSLEVYPAASLIHFCPDSVPKYLVDPQAHSFSHIKNLHLINEKAGTGIPSLVTQLIADAHV
jgi:NAD-dependent deacetylase